MNENASHPAAFRARGPPRCFECGELGHKMDRCPSVNHSAGVSMLAVNRENLVTKLVTKEEVTNIGVLIICVTKHLI